MAKKPQKAPPKPPKHLAPATATWWAGVAEDYYLEDHHLRLLTLAAQAWDRAEQAREILAEKGITYADRFDQPRSRPEVAVERDNRLAFARLLRELALDEGEPPEPRPPRVGGK